MRQRVAPPTGPDAFRIGGRSPVARVLPGEIFEVDSDDAFSGRVDSVASRPREVAPFPRVNPLSGPVAIEGAQPGDLLAVHVADVAPTRDWGVSTMSPNFGALSGTKHSPNLQPDTGERVWIWTLERTTATARSEAADGIRLEVPFRPFLGTLAVAPAHGEVRTSTVPDALGGNLDSPLVRPGATVYLQVNEPGGLVHVGDGHYAQGDGEFCGTAVEGAVRSTMVAEVLPDDGLGDWPRIETDEELIVVGVGRPLEDAFRVAVHSLTRWVAQLSGLDLDDAYQLVSQTCTARVANLVNPSYTVTVAVETSRIPHFDPAARAHARLRAAYA
jgi:acetamidase/formamidase